MNSSCIPDSSCIPYLKVSTKAKPAGFDLNHATLCLSLCWCPRHGNSMSRRQRGHILFLLNHLSIQCLWNLCAHGRLRSRWYCSNCTKQIAHEDSGSSCDIPGANLIRGNLLISSIGAPSGFLSCPWTSLFWFGNLQLNNANVPKIRNIPLTTTPVQR